MKYLFLSASILAVVGCKQSQPETHNTPPPVVQQEPSSDTTLNNIELVFCLDATGSMSGLIHTAKEKIWSIVSELAKSEDEPDIRLGMVFYRDRGDSFVTKIHPLTSDIDSLYSELMDIHADGGGDAPESVNLALYEAINKMQWSEGVNTYRTVFLVGDCPPHMDYNQEAKYPEICEKANQKHITINTIKLGSDCGDARLHFRAIAMNTNGSYQELDQDATDVHIQTPYDDSIQDISICIDTCKIYYGSSSEKATMNARKEKTSSFYSSASSTANSDRTMYNLSKSGKKNWFGKKELINDLDEGTIELKDVSEEELPDELKGLTKEEQATYINELQQQRKENVEQLKELNKKRQDYIEKVMESEEKPLFSKEVVKTMKEQAKKQKK